MQLRCRCPLRLQTSGAQHEGVCHHRYSNSFGAWPCDGGPGAIAFRRDWRCGPIPPLRRASCPARRRRCIGSSGRVDGMRGARGCNSYHHPKMTSPEAAAALVTWRVVGRIPDRPLPRHVAQQLCTCAYIVRMLGSVLASSAAERHPESQQFRSVFSALSRFTAVQGHVFSLLGD